MLYLCNENDTRIAHESLSKITNKNIKYTKNLFYMKHRFTFLFALLCASMMTWAAEPITGSSTENMAGQGNPFTNGYDYSFSSEGTNVTISFTEKEGYTDLVAYLWNYTNGFAETGMTVSGSTATITLTEQTPGATIRFACKFAYTGGMSVTKEFTYTIPVGEGGGGTESGVIDWSSISWLGNGIGPTEYTDKYKAVVTPDLAGTGINNLQPNGGHKCIHIAFPSAEFGTISLSNSQYHTEGAGMFVHLDAFTYKQTEFTIENNGTTYTFTVYYADGQEGSAVMVPEIYDVNFALASNGSTATASSGNADLAIDGNDGTRWESAQTDDETYTLDMGQLRVFNTVKINWEGAFCSQFELTYSTDGIAYQPLYTETALAAAGWQTIEIEKTTARYIKYHGTKRATGYGQSFWEFQVLLPGVSTLTTIDLNAANTIAKVGGEGIVLTAAAKDQNSNPMSGIEITYEVTPAGAGSVVEGKYIPEKIGEATIIAKSGEVKSAAVNIFGYAGDNLALSTDIISANKVIAQSEFAPNGTDAFHAVDGNEGSVWQGSPTNGTTNDEAARTYDAWFVVDLGAFYSIDLITIKFEGACAQNYHIDFSADNTNWELGYNYEGNAGIFGRTDMLHKDLVNKNKVRYVRFWSTKAATEWGMKIHEFQVFGTPAATPTKTVSASVNDATMGSATVEQEGVEVTEVTTGSEVTFNAVANDGYIFVEWSNGEKNATFTTTVDATLNLTATFRKLGTTYCNTEFTAEKEGITYNVYVTYKKTTNDNEYALVVRSTKAMVNFSNAYVSHSPIGETNQTNMNGLGMLTDGGKTLSYTFTSLIEPGMNTPLYINFVNGEGSTEVTFLPQLTDIEFAVSCEDNVEVESIALDPFEATIEIGESKTLVPIFTPAYAIDQTVSWSSNKESIVSVTDGVIFGNAEGEAVITATSANGKTATCSITVEPISEKTWWGLTTITEWDNMPVMYSITRNIDKTLTYTVYFGGDASGKVMQINNGDWNALTGYTDSERKASFTTTTTYESGTQIKPSHFFYFGGPRIELADEYVVGASNEKPSTAVESVVISHSTASLMKDETIQLVASVVPAYADDKTLIWSSEYTNIATVDNNGLVTAIAEGATTITATSNNGKTASCVVTVVGALEPATWYGTAVFEVKGNPVAVNYSITRTSDRTLTYRTVLSETVTGMSMQLNDGEYRLMTQDATGRIAEWTSTNTYLDGATHSMFFYPAFEGGADSWDVDYIVGSSNEKPNTLVAFGDQADNTAKITEYADEVVDAYINRTFPNTDEWYTLCLPFDMDETLLAATFGAGYTLATLGSSEDRGSLIHLNFDYVNTLEAGKPYLLRPGVSTVTVPMIEAVTIKNVDPSAALQKVESTHMQFQGTFAPTTLEGDNKRFVGPNNYLYSPAEDGTTMGAFRCYFTIPVESQALVGSKAARIVFGPQVTTGTENVQSDQVQSTKVIIDGTLYIIRGERTYNAQGQLVK